MLQSLTLFKVMAICLQQRFAIAQETALGSLSMMLNWSSPLLSITFC